MATGDPQQLIPCPFNPVHMVQRKRMQYHIMKCQKNIDMRKFRKCPFNAQHIMPVEEYEQHVRTCEGRATVEKEMLYRQQMRNPGIVSGHGSLQVPPSNFVIPETTECWDDDDVTVVFGAGSSEKYKTQPAALPTTKTTSWSREKSTRLPLRGESEGTKVFEYSVNAPTNKSPVKGRGRGRGLTQLMNNGSRPGGGLRLPMAVDTSPSETSEMDTGAETGTDSELTAEEKTAKDIRKLKKMYRQIIKIEGKQAEGGVLLQEQLDKLSRKDDVIAGLRLLGVTEFNGKP